jgi:hypothetical protein
VKLIARHRVMWTGIKWVRISTIYHQFLDKSINHNETVLLCVKPSLYSIGMYAGPNDNVEIYGRPHVIA